jgi:15-hydroxyprostaglandin dehydrogenase (NAD)
MKHAIISGGCSGIGLSLARHLLSKGTWKICIADINDAAFTSITPPLDPSHVTFIQTDVASWDSHASLLKQAFTWSNQRIDAYFANAGIGDRDSFFLPWDLDAEPAKPDLSCVDVCETANYYALKLFVHYSRKTTLALGGPEQARQAGFHPKLTFTASCVALYPFMIAPQYNAAKHAVLGLTRGVGQQCWEIDGIAVNCIMPAVIDTAILPGNLRSTWPQEYITPLTTLNRAFDELIEPEGKVQQDGKSGGVDGEPKRGQSIECALDRLYYRTHYEPPDESQAYFLQDAKKNDGLWMQSIMAVMQERATAAQQDASTKQDSELGVASVTHVESA